MKIFYDGVIFLHQKHGGVNRIFSEIPSRIQALDPSVDVHLYRFPGTPLRNPLPFGFYTIPKLGGALRRLDRYFLGRELGRIQPDIYHTTYYRMPERTSARTVLTVYDMIHEKFPQYFGDPSRFIAHKKRCIEAADKVIAISESTKQDILDFYGVRPEKIDVIHLAASLSFTPAGEEEKRSLRRKYSLERPFLLYVGQRSGYKNFAALLKAFTACKANRDLDLICVGGASAWTRQERDILQGLPRENSVRLFSGVSDGELRVFYSAASLFVYPSLYEGFGIPVLEAMACGAPVLGTRSSSIPEIGRDAGMYFDPASEDALREAIDKIVGDTGRQSSMREKGYRRAASFSWDKNAKETFSLYTSILREGPCTA